MFRIVRTGTIFTCSILLCLLVLLVARVPQAKAATPPTTNWPIFGFDAQSTKFNPYEKTLSPSNVSKLKLAWQQIGQNYGYTDSQEVVNGVVYIIEDDGTVQAFNALSGKLEWSRPLRASASSTSVVVENGLVYVGGSDIDTDHDVVYALNAKTGAIVWMVPLSNSEKTGFQATITYADGMLFGTWNDGDLHAFNAATGKQLWSQFTLSGYSSPAIANGLIYVGGAGYTGAGQPNYVYAFHEKSGSLAWKAEVPNLGRATSGTVVANGIVYVCDSDNAVLLAYNATTGMLLWSFPAPEGNSMASPATVNGVVYVPSADDHLYAIDAKTGKLRWSFATNGSIAASPALANGVVYFTSVDNNIYALNANSGQKLWSYLLHDNNDSFYHGAPTIVNGMLFVSSLEALSAFHLS